MRTLNRNRVRRLQRVLERVKQRGIGIEINIERT